MDDDGEQGPLGGSGTSRSLEDGLNARLRGSASGPQGVEPANWYLCRPAQRADRAFIDEDGDDAWFRGLFDSIHNAVTSDALEEAVTKLLGPSAFSVGVIAGMGMDVLRSASDLLDLVRILALADLHDAHTTEYEFWDFTNPLRALRRLVASAAGHFYAEELRIAATERDAIVSEMAEALRDPIAMFEGMGAAVAAELKSDWASYQAALKCGTLQGQYDAGFIFGGLLVEVLALITGVAGAVKATAKIATKMPKLLRFARKAKLKPRPGPRKRLRQNSGGSGGGSTSGQSSTGGGSNVPRDSGGTSNPRPTTSHGTKKNSDGKSKPPDKDADEAARRQQERRRIKALRKRSAKGDKDATYELNRIEDSLSSRAENAVADHRGDQVVKAGEQKVKTSRTFTEIDVETATEVIEVKSGRLRGYALDEQAAKHAEHAKSLGKDHVLAYNRNVYPEPGHPDLAAIRQSYPDVRLEAFDFE